MSKDSKKSLKIHGIPTPVCALARNDEIFRQSETEIPGSLNRGFVFFTRHPP